MSKPEGEIDLFLNEIAKEEEGERESDEAWEEYLEEESRKDQKKIMEQVDLILSSILRWIREGG